MNPTPSRLLPKLSVATLVAVYLLILVGGIVRSTGSGMGCPDWPKCFSSWVPPTEVSQLPQNYKEVYAQKRAEKNTRVTGYLNVLGFAELAERVKNDKSILIEADFNVAKTWTEYVNRLIGAIIGLLIFATFLASLKYWHSHRSLVWVSLAAVILVGFQGWVGSIVVSTNLLPGMITFHMLIALIIVSLLIYVAFRAQPAALSDSNQIPKKEFIQINTLLIVLVLLTLGQILLGTQVRESVDVVAKELGEERRQEWIDALGSTFTLHRSLSFIVIAAHLWLMATLFQRFGINGNLTRWSLVLVVVIGLEIVSGGIMAYFGIPRVAQPIHLLLATVAFGIQLFLLMKINSPRLAKPDVTEEIEEYASY
ncbi:COX15/CtaA family protein [Tunicatimonas pelagia]|uniref:COX15/CtaA family protein n=1 Tax=Tunicatimonas pelagia TaxID=931531 RepID=UPI0026656E54|nr:COX15/CtaA family protein [Tunicatimonas pelagia]WKN44389.1 COX15/CtaA family protein [Tunicatimonas pelagia]